MTADPPRVATALRLLIVYEGHGRSGTATTTRLLVGGLGPSVEVTVVAADLATAEWIAADRPGAVPLAHPVIRGWRSVGAMRSYRRLLHEVRPHVVHLNYPSPGTGTRYLALVAKSVRGVRSVAVEHTYGSPVRGIARISTALCAAALDAHVSGGDDVARTIEREFGLRRGSIRTIPYGVPTKPGARTPRVSPGPVVTTVARLAPEKAIDVLVQATADLPGVHLVVVGDGPERGRLEELAQTVGVTDRVHWVGFTPRPQDSLTACDVFVLPSRHEALSLAVIEAMAAGLPVVATDVGSVSDAVDHGTTGILVPPDDVAALRDAIQVLVGDPALRARMGAAGRSRYDARFRVERMVDAYQDLYDEISPPARRAAASVTR